MSLKSLSHAGWAPTPITMGCEALGGTDWGKVDPIKAREAVRAAVDCGISTFDTADVYGLGNSEIELSNALGSDRHQAFIVSKFGVRWEQNSPDDRAVTFRDSSPRYLLTAIEASLRRLNIEAIPLYLVHWPDPSTPLRETLQALDKIKQAGKILNYGLSNFRVEEVVDATRNYNVCAYEGDYSLLRRNPFEQISRELEGKKVARFCYGVLAQGVLTGKYNAKSKFEQDDRRSRLAQFDPGRWNYNEVQLDRLRVVAEKYEKTPAQVAIQWVLQGGRVDSAIVGAKTPEQVRLNIEVMHWKMTDEDLAYLSDSKNNNSPLNPKQ